MKIPILDNIIENRTKEKYGKVIDKLIKSLDVPDIGNWTMFNPEKFGIAANPKTNLFLQEYVDWNYANVSVISEAISEIQFKLFQYDAKNKVVDEIKEHPLLELLYKVNPTMTKGDFIFALSANLLLTGEAPIRLRRKNPANLREIPYELYPISPADMRVFIGYTSDNYELIAKYTIKDKSDPNDLTAEITLNPWEVLFLKTLNPYNPHRGAGVVEAAAITLDTLKFSENFNLNFFKNSAVPYSILYTDQTLKKDTLERLKNNWDKNYRGFDNAYKTAILEQGLKLDKLQTGQKDMDFLEQQKFMRDKLMAMYKTNPVILGVIENANRASADSSEYVFMKHCIRPKMRLLTEYLNEYLVPLFDPMGKEGIFLDFVDPVKEDRTQEIHQWSVAVDKWMTKNEIRERDNLPPIDGGDEIYQPINLQPLGTKPIQPSQPKPVGPNANAPAEPNMNPDGSITQPNASNGGTELGYRIFKVKESDKLKYSMVKFSEQIARMQNRNTHIKQLQKEFVGQITKLMRVRVMKKYNGKKKVKIYGDIKLAETKDKFISRILMNSDKFENDINNIIIEKIFNPQEIEIIKNIKKEGTKFLLRGSAKKSANKYLFNSNSWEKIVIDLIKPILLKIMKTQGQEAMELIGGFSYSIQDDANNFLNLSTVSASKSIVKTISEKLSGIISEGIAKNENEGQLIEKVKKTYSDLRNYKTSQITRTEVSRATNFSIIDAYKQSGIVKGKKWLLAPDEISCQFCNQATSEFNKESLDKILLKKGDTFKGTEDGIITIDYMNIVAPPLHNNCRCISGPILEEIKIEEPEKIKENEKESVKEVQKKSDEKAEKLLDQIEKELAKEIDKSQNK